MASNEKVEGNKPHLKFDFTYWEVFSVLYATHIHPVCNMYTPCIHRLNKVDSMATVQNEILNRFIVPSTIYKLT